MTLEKIKGSLGLNVTVSTDVFSLHELIEADLSKPPEAFQRDPNVLVHCVITKVIAL